MEIKKSCQLNIRMTPDEYRHLKEESLKQQLKLADYCRLLLLKTEIPDREENVELLKIGEKFIRISNFFNSGIWSDSEREEFKKELKSVISEIRNYVQWS